MISQAQAVAIAVVVLPALGFALWPVLRGARQGGAARAARPDDGGLELLEEKAAIYRALNELAFDHEAGHLSEDDYRALRQRYESRAGVLLAALDALRPAQAEPVRERVAAQAPPTPRGFTRHPVALAGGAVLVLVFGVVIGINASRFAAPEQPMATPGGRSPMPVMPEIAAGPPATMPGEAAAPPGATGKTLPPEVLAGMLNAARQSLFDGRYQEAIAAYQAVLKRDARNVDAMTHLGLIVAIGGHADAALETFDRALAIDPKYAPAHLYRGQVLYEVKQDYPGAVKAWQRFLALVPSGEEHVRVAALVKEARGKQGAR